MTKKINLILLTIILVLGLTLRLKGLSNPVADWHSWRQADTASVTREYLKQGISLTQPKYHDLSSIPSGQENPSGFRMVELPIYNLITATLYQNFFSSFNFEAFHRLVSITFSLGSAIYLYLLISSLSSSFLGLLSALFFSILPYNVFYGRTILPEVPLVFFTLAFSYHFFKLYQTKKYSIKNPHYWLSLVFFSLSLTLKPYSAVLLLTSAYLVLTQQKLKAFKLKSLYLFLILSFIPFILWRVWIQNFPEGIPSFMWLLNGNNIRFKGSFFRWIFAKRIGELILGFWGIGILVSGLVEKGKSISYGYYLSWLSAIVIYLTIFATGNVQHDYYQIITIPIISVLLAKGTRFLLKLAKKNPITYLVLGASIVFMLAFSWFEVRGLFNINHPEIVKAGQAVDRLLPANAKVIAPYQGDTAFLYQTNRTGWPIGGSIEDKVEMGATHYVSVNQDDEANDLLDRCQVIEKTDQYLIIDLLNCK